MAKTTIRVVAQVIASPGKEEVLKSLLLELVPPTRQEPGCLSYELLQSAANSRQFFFVEEWENEECLNAHLTSEHLQEAFIEGADFLERPPEIYQCQPLA
jgi:quinol monooxygenase YgiN